MTPQPIVQSTLLFALLAALAIAGSASVWPVLGWAFALLLPFALVLWLRARLRGEAAVLADGGNPSSAELLQAALAHRSRARQAEQDLQSLNEKRLQLEVLLEGMQDGVLAVDAARRVEWTNGEMGRILDTHGPGAVIRLGRSLTHTLRDPALLQFVDGVFAQEAPPSLRTSTLLPGRIFDVTAALLPNGGAVLVFRDVTRTEAMERAQREFVANVSHELRTPLTSVRGYSETLLDSGLIAPEAELWLQVVVKNVDRMSRLTEDLLVLARTEAPDRKSLRHAVSAGTLLEDAVRTFQGQAAGAGVVVEVAVTTAALVLVDEVAILQVLGNLLENAAKYGRPADGAGARIEVAAEEQNGTAVLFRVRDFGGGIAMEHHNRIFERFYRVDKARSRDSGGTGLGLAIARYLVEENGGTIALVSSLGQGAEFRFTLPVAATAPEPAITTEMELDRQPDLGETTTRDAVGSEA